MRLILSHILTPIFYLVFGFFLGVFHILQVIAFNLFGRSAQQKVVFLLNTCLLNSLRILGTSISYSFEEKLPENTPIIFLANHTSMHDITGLYSILQKYNPIFVSKRSLASGIPSISYNLRKSGAAIIDRGDRKQAMAAIFKMGEFIQENNFSAVIFPEGTRSKKFHPFKIGGTVALLKKAPDAIVVPIAIEGTGDLLYGKKSYPLQVGASLKWSILKPIDPKGKTPDEVLELAYQAVKKIMVKD